MSTISLRRFDEPAWLLGPDPRDSRPQRISAANARAMQINLGKTFGPYLGQGTVAAAIARSLKRYPDDADRAEEAARRDLAEIMMAF